MQVYSYDSDSLHFNGVTVAQECQIEAGVFHHPAWTTTEIPPNYNPATQTCRFHEGRWVIGVRTSTELPVNASPGEVDAALAADLLHLRDASLRNSDWKVLRHQEEGLLRLEPSLSPLEWQILLTYRQSLRDLPLQPGFPRVGLPVEHALPQLAQGVAHAVTDH
jgi:hypothetical protein